MPGLVQQFAQILGDQVDENRGLVGGLTDFVGVFDGPPSAINGRLGGREKLVGLVEFARFERRDALGPSFLDDQRVIPAGRFAGIARRRSRAPGPAPARAASGCSVRIRLAGLISMHQLALAVAPRPAGRRRLSAAKADRSRAARSGFAGRVPARCPLLAGRCSPCTAARDPAPICAFGACPPRHRADRRRPGRPTRPAIARPSGATRRGGSGSASSQMMSASAATCSSPPRSTETLAGSDSSTGPSSTSRSPAICRRSRHLRRASVRGGDGSGLRGRTNTPSPQAGHRSA